MSSDGLNILIVDDEPPARSKLRRWLSEERDVATIAECADGQEAARLLRTRSFDLAMLDIEMPGMNGFSLIENLQSSDIPPIIFVTAYNQYAVDAFDIQALDYLMKPYDRPRLQQALDRFRSYRHAKKESWPPDGNGRSHPYLSRFVVKTRSRVLLIEPGEVDWIEACGNYVKLHVGPVNHLVRGAIGRIENSLDPARFPRIHRSTIVNLEQIKELLPASHGDYIVVLQDGTKLVMSRTYKDKIRSVLKLPL